MIDYLIFYALSFVGTPYKFGGNTPLDGGMDCSGYVGEVLKAAGILDNHADLSAQGIYNYLTDKKQHLKSASISNPERGAVSFYGKDLRHISHVALCINDKLMINAGGGNESVLTKEDAITAEAFIKIRPVNYRHDLVAILMPNY